MSDSDKPKRKGQFVKGDPRINRAGRPEIYREFQASYRDLEPEARYVLHRQLQGEDEELAHKAAVEILNRGWGKAPLAVTGEGGEGSAGGVGFVVVLPAEREE